MIKRKWYACAAAAVTVTICFSKELGTYIGGGESLGGALVSALTSAAVAAVVGGLFYAAYRWEAEVVEYTPTMKFWKFVGIPTAVYGLILISVGAGNGSSTRDAAAAAAASRQQAAEFRARAASAVAEQPRIAALSPEERQELTETPIVNTAHALMQVASKGDHSPQTRGPGWDGTKKQLTTITKASPRYPEAQTLLASMVVEDRKFAAEELRETSEAKKKAADLTKVQEPLEIAARKAYATTLEQQFLEQRMDTTVLANGSKSTNLSIKWVLASRVTAHDLANAGLLNQAKHLGFKSVVFFNGFDSELGERWSWDLTK